jgi:mannose-6-phosphate isomerase-like protein (cupin superfamily)
MQDNGPNPYVANIEELTIQNDNFRTALWTGNSMQLTVMAIQPGDDIGLEIHDDHDQFLRIEEGIGFVQMGQSQDDLDFEADVEDNDAIFVPAGTWHNVTNTGDDILRLYSIYAPSEHPRGTIHETKAIADAAEAAEQDQQVFGE